MDTTDTTPRERAQALLKRLFEPLCIAAYVTWAAVFADVVQSEPSGPLKAFAPALPIAVMLAFLASFVATHFSPEGSRTRQVLLVAQLVFALALLPTVRTYSTPILLTIAMAQVPTVLPHRWLVFLGANAVLYVVADLLWLSDRPELVTSAGLADELLGDIRGVVRQMRLHDGVELAEAIRQVAAPFPKPRIVLEIEPELRVADVTQAEALLRAAQEALTNAARHSGAAHVTLKLARSPGGVSLEVVDDGDGARTLEVGHGLRGMRERIESVGGQLEYGNTANGFAVRAFLPALPA